MKTSWILISILAVGLMACDKLNKADDAMDDVHHLSAKTNEMNDSLQYTKEQIRQQKLQVCLGAMQSDYAVQRLYPVPTGLMPYAQCFAETATAKEITDYTKLMLKSIDEVRPFKHFGADGQEIDDTPEMQYKTLLENYRDFQGVMAIAGFIPDATLQAIIANNENAGVDQVTMNSILMMRVLFIRQVLVQDLYLDKGQFYTVGQAEDAVASMKKVESILRMKDAANFSIKTSGLKGPDGYNGPIDNADLKMDADTIAFLDSGWQSIADMAAAMPLDEQLNSTDPKVDKVEIRREIKRRQAVVHAAQSYADGWKPKNP